MTFNSDVINILILCFALFATHNWFSVLWLVVYEENKVPVVQHPLVVIQQCLYFVPSKNEMENLSSLTPILCSKAGYYWVFYGRKKQFYGNKNVRQQCGVGFFRKVCAKNAFL